MDQWLIPIQVRPDSATHDAMSVATGPVIYCGPDQQAAAHGNRIDIYSDSRSGQGMR